jgi:hypothetical protein
MGKKKLFKMDEELNAKINAIRVMQGWNNDQIKKPTKTKGGKNISMFDSAASPRNEAKGVAGTRLITHLDKMAVFGMFERDSSSHMKQYQAMIRKIANGGEISEKEIEEEEV